MMVGKRKRNRRCRVAEDCPRKRLRGGSVRESASATPADCNTIKHPVLSLYYPCVVTLRRYLLSELPTSSKARRRRLLAAGLEPAGLRRGKAANAGELEDGFGDDPQRVLACLLDTTLVCGLERSCSAQDQSRINDLATFSQHQSKSTAGSSPGSGNCSQSEIVDFVIWQLFTKRYRSVHKPLHLLCHGYQRASISRQAHLNLGTAGVIPGIVSHYPNDHVNALKSTGWTGLLSLLGKEAERLMLDLLLDKDIFVPAATGSGNYYQLSGVPLSERQVLEKPSTTPPDIPKSRSDPGTSALARLKQGSTRTNLHSPGNITFVRSRMLYARGALNAKGEVRFGLRHIHVFNRFPDFKNPEHTLHILMYIFPRQFGLHNAFTCKVDPKETVQPFKDYTLREQEIAHFKAQGPSRRITKGSTTQNREDHVPRRLRGMVQELISKMQKLHGRCAYTELLRYYCPNLLCNEPLGRSALVNASQSSLGSQFTQLNTQVISSTRTSSLAITASARSSASPRKQSIMDFATPAADVSAFCQAVLANVVPNELWGSAQDHNKESVMRNVDRFVTMRRFECLSLHEVVQGIKIRSVPWLIPPNMKSDAALSQSDLSKRTEIFSEFIYYIFDSLVIPLIRSNFHVTESSIHRNRLFFFRHDVWRSLSEPSLSAMKLSMFEEMKMERARSVLDARALGFSQIRLLPKETGVRPIMNLRRRVLKAHNGRVMLGRSVNSVMAPVFNMLSYEKVKQADKLSSALFCVGDMYPKIKAFKERLQNSCLSEKALYFAKVDVQSCFDTIPQRRVLEIIEKLVSEDEYSIARHSEIKAPNPNRYRAGVGPPAKPARKFIAKARPTHDLSVFEQTVNNEFAVRKKNTVFVDSVVRNLQNKDDLLDLLEEHVERNIVKIGKKFYRQKEGIPQGSVISTLLCSFFYGELERECLDFLTDGNSLLLRLIDDFLLITTRKEHAQGFLQIMHNGVEKYGVGVNREKSLVNFETNVNGSRIPRLIGTARFPYCGNLIDTRSLEITKDREQRRQTAISDSLTVELSRVPGKTFHRKVLDSFKIQAHAMFLDTSFNSLNTVLCNIYRNFLVTATRFYHYLKCLPSGRQPKSSLLMETFSDLVDLAFNLTKSKQRSTAVQSYQCAVSRQQIKWLASMAFRHVLGRKQSRYREVNSLLDGLIEASTAKGAVERTRMGRVIREGNRMFHSFKF